MRYWIAIVCIVTTLGGFGQKTETPPLADTASKPITGAIENIPSKSLDYIEKKYTKLSNDVQKQVRNC